MYYTGLKSEKNRIQLKDDLKENLELKILKWKKWKKWILKFSEYLESI